ncbi:hypothetical protein NXX53_13650 [Bacteroides salyersiae]|nr:hypothetical protein [Bacteroides salyersiae]
MPEMIDTYNDLQMMDLDGLSEEEMTNCRKPDHWAVRIRCSASPAHRETV